MLLPILELLSGHIISSDRGIRLGGKVYTVSLQVLHQVLTFQKVEGCKIKKILKKEKGGRKGRKSRGERRGGKKRKEEGKRSEDNKKKKREEREGKDGFNKKAKQKQRREKK